MVVKADQPSSTPEQGKDTPKEKRVVAPGISNLIREFTVSGNLSTEGNEYIDTLRKITGDKAQSINIKEKWLSSPNGSIMFTYDNYAVVLVFSEVISGSMDATFPVSMCNRIASEEAMRILGPGGNILNVIVVTPKDYPKVKIMAGHIATLLKAAVSKSLATFSLHNDMKQAKYGIDSSYEHTKRFIEGLSPHAVTNRMDIGFTITMETGENDGISLSNGPGKRFDPIIAVGAYVELLPDFSKGTISPKSIPIVHITEIASVLPTEKTLSIAIPAAVDVFLVRNRWEEQFNNFEKGGTNIGNILINPETGEPWAVSSHEDKTWFVNNMIERPVLAIDIVDGRARIPGLEKFATNDRSVLTTYGDFMAADFTTIPYLAQEAYKEIVGTVEEKGNVYDSRTVDYMSTARYLKSNPKIKEFLTRQGDPTLRANLIQEMRPEFERFYLNTVMIVNFDLVSKLAAEIGKYLNIRTSLANDGSIDMSPISAQSSMFGNNTMSVMTSNFGNQQGWWTR